MKCRLIKYLKFSLSGIILVPISLSIAESQKNNFDAEAQKILISYYNKYKDLEYFSGGELSIYLPNQNVKNYYVGYKARDSKKPEPVNANTLFEIGSITKSFTSAIILQLEKEGKLSLNDSLKKQLPQYNRWSGVTLRELLNMTSGIPNYTDAPLFNAQLYYNLSRVWSDQELIDLAIPPGNLAPPLKTGFFYSNTNYILASLVIEKVTHNKFSKELKARTLALAHLHNTFYILHNPKSDIQDRLAHGYAYNQYDNPAMTGKDISEGNLSWAAAAGALISNSEDIIKWVHALFRSDQILNKKQQAQLTSLISQKTGQPMIQAADLDTHRFGLGVAQADAGLGSSEVGRVWFYEGQTLGFRAIYWYKECNGVIISAIFNSATNPENDHIGELLKQIYPLILSKNPSLACQEASSF